MDAAEYWNEQVAIGQKIRDRTTNYMQVRYEDLKQTGVAQLRDVYQFLGVESDNELCERAFTTCSIGQVKKDQAMPEGFFRKGELDSWREELSPRDVKMIEYLTSEMMKELDYEPTMPPYRRPPMRLWRFRKESRVAGWLDRKLRRMLNRLHLKWIGRLAHPEAEFTVY